MDALSKYKPDVPSIFEQFEPDTSLPQDEYAFDVYQKLLFAKRSHEVLFLVIGRLLKEIRDAELYRKLDYENFGDFLGSEEVSFSRESAYLYIRVFEYYIEHLELDEGRIQQINVSRLALMMPLLRRIEDKQEVLDKINELSTLRHKDFMLKIKQARSNDKPSVYYSRELDKWIVEYYNNRTNLLDLGSFEEYLAK
jgi:hypothetical protein